jgi:nicotinamidase-related amidase
MNAEKFIENSIPFLKYVADWQAQLKPLPLSEIIKGQADHVAVISVDVINGFCYEGPLASPRVAGIVAPIVALFRQSYDAGVHHFILTQDTHPPDAVEFEQFPPHCLAGHRESATVDQFQELPFFGQFQIIPKKSLNSFIGTSLEAWLDTHPEVTTLIVVGDCTDLCVHQLAMPLKLRGNVRNEKVRVILPVNCIDTYDLPLDVAAPIGAVPHNGDLFHTLFLYHMMLNGMEVVAGVE